MGQVELEPEPELSPGPEDVPRSCPEVGSLTALWPVLLDVLWPVELGAAP